MAPPRKQAETEKTNTLLQSWKAPVYSKNALKIKGKEILNYLNRPNCYMTAKYKKLLFQILRGTSDANILFDDLCKLLLKLGF